MAIQVGGETRRNPRKQARLLRLLLRPLHVAPASVTLAVAVTTETADNTLGDCASQPLSREGCGRLQAGPFVGWKSKCFSDPSLKMSMTWGRRMQSESHHWRCDTSAAQGSETFPDPSFCLLLLSGSCVATGRSNLCATNNAEPCCEKS